MKREKKIDPEYIRKKASEITEEDLKRIVEESEKIEARAREKGKLREYLDEVKLLISLVKDYLKGRYRDVSYVSITIVAFTLIYIVNMIDFFPDFLPAIGVVDDLTVLGFALKTLSKELVKYKTWKSNEAEVTD
ncbi:MAG TPA: hypothetical protein DDX92_11650 [Flavobacteriales bacterium]|jgi:uncharacterized membrane protein YkvA (DUF1232 family)|nr:hypothetical protein [Flavobacteriales bacterium]